jgi:hypothetical protein
LAVKANAKAQQAQQQTLALVQQEVAAQDQARKTQNYSVIGRVLNVETGAGLLYFERQKGPAIAAELDDRGEATGRLLFVAAWDGKLPERQEYSEEFCKACLVVCDVCSGKKTTLCTLTGCGGRGKQATGETFCECVIKSAKLDPECVNCHGKGLNGSPCGNCINNTGRPDPKCTTCRGYGAVQTYRECPSCKGSGTAACAACRGTGKRPSGFATPPVTPGGKSLATGAIAKCTSCRGTMRAGKWKAQNIAPMVMGVIGPYMSFGPVLRLVVEPIPGGAGAGQRFATRWENQGAQRNAFIRIPFDPAPDGTPCMVLLPMTAKDSAMPYFYGGSQA